MSNNVESSVGKIQLRAITGKEVKEIAIHVLTKAIQANPSIKQFLTFHNFRMEWGFRIKSLADTPVPPEVSEIMNVSALDISDEEIAAMWGNIEALMNKRKSLDDFLRKVAILDKYLAEATIVAEDKGEISDERRPDVLRQKVGLPIMVTQQVGPRLAEVPLQPETPISTEEQKEEKVNLDI